METHVKMLGIFYIVLGGLGLLGSGLLFIILVGAGLISGDGEAMVVTAMVGMAIAALVTMFSIPGIICGFGLLNHRAWARVLVLVLGCVNLAYFPLGTALGIYTLWVLVHRDVEPVFAGA